jgi:hypothetical protein
MKINTGKRKMLYQNSLQSLSIGSIGAGIQTKSIFGRE